MELCSEMEENKVIIYTANDGKTKIDVKLEEETLWLTQAQMCELYQTSKSNVSEHIKHIFEEGELNEDSVVRKFRTTAADGKEYLVSRYNLDLNLHLTYKPSFSANGGFYISAPATDFAYESRPFPLCTLSISSDGVQSKCRRVIWARRWMFTCSSRANSFGRISCFLASEVRRLRSCS